MTQKTGNRLARIAAGYARLGLSVFPVKGRLLCVEDQGHWKDYSSSDPLEVEVLFHLYPEANGIALDCDKSGIVGIEFEGQDGTDIFNQVNTSYNISANTWSISTSGGGLTLLFEADKNSPIETSLHHNINAYILGTESYCLLPPSTEGGTWIKGLDPKNARLVPVDDSIKALIGELKELKPSWLPDREEGISIPSTNAADLLKKDIPPLTELVTNMIVPGLTILASPPKSGKSWLVLSMCIAICTGQKFLNKETKKVPTLYLALEDGERRLQSRLCKLAPDIVPEGLKDLDIVYQAPRLRLPGRDGKYSYERNIDNDLITYLDYWHENSKQLFFIDVFQKIRCGTGNKNAYEVEYLEGSLLQSWASKNTASIVLVHHFKKGSQGMDPMERIGGSTGVTGSADTLITMERDRRTDKEAIFTITGRDVSMQEFKCSFHNGIWRYEGAIADNEAEAFREKYERNPIVQTIRHLLTGEKKYQGTATELTEEMLKLCGYKAQGVKIDKRKISDIQNDLYLYDKISYEYKVQSNIRLHIFTQHEKKTEYWYD